jgi:AAA domain-containing protein
MIRRIRLVNFMSHTDTVIEPADGLTILVGQNNCGKSAIVSALQILSGNATGDYMVRHGERECVISVETDEGHTVEWRRKGKTVSYRINGRDVHRLQGGVPDELHGLLRLPEVQAEGGSFDIHFAEQKDPIFLLSETAGRRATFFASSSDAIKLIEMQNVHRRKIQEAKSRETGLVRREGFLDARVQSLSSLEKIEEPLRDLEACHKELQEDLQAIERFKEHREQLARNAQLHKEWTDKARALKSLAAPPIPTDTKSLSELVENRTSAEASVSLGAELSAALSRLTAPPDLPDLAPAADLIHHLADTKSKIDWNKSVTERCQALSAPPELSDTAFLGSTIVALQTSRTSVRTLKDKLISLETMEAPPNTFATEGLSELTLSLSDALQKFAGKQAIVIALSELDASPTPADAVGPKTAIESLDYAAKQVALHKLEAKRHSDTLADTKRELLGLADKLNTCPVCGQAFDPDTLVATAALQMVVSNGK